MRTGFKIFNQGILLFLFIYCSDSATVPMDDNISSVVRFTNSLVPPLFQIFSGNYSNLVLAPFGLASSLAITMDCVNGESLNEFIRVFKLQSKSARQKLRAGFKTIINDFKQNSNNNEVAGSFSKAVLISSKVLPISFMEQLSNIYSVDVTVNNSLTNNYTSVQVLELRTDSGIMSHWKDYEKLVVFTYLSYVAEEPFYVAENQTIRIPMIPLIGYIKAGYLSNLQCHGAELLFENNKVSLLLLMPDQITDGLGILKAKLFQANFFDVLDSLPEQETQILIPQLSAITNNLEFIPFLKLLGIVSIFNTEVTAQQKQEIYVQSMKQNAFFSTTFTSLNSIGTFSTKYNERI